MFAKFAQFIDPNLRMLSSLNNHIVQYKTVVELNDYHKEFSGSPRTGPTKRICTVVLGLSENNKVQDSICKFCKPTSDSFPDKNQSGERIFGIENFSEFRYSIGSHNTLLAFPRTSSSFHGFSGNDDTIPKRLLISTIYFG